MVGRQHFPCKDVGFGEGTSSITSLNSFFGWFKMVGNSTMVLLPYLVTILRGVGYGLSLFCWGNLLLLVFSGKTWGNDIYIYIYIYI